MRKEPYLELDEIDQEEIDTHTTYKKAEDEDV